MAEMWQNKTSPHALFTCMKQFGLLPDDIVLDIGAGTGALFNPLLRLIGSGKIVAADISERMLKEASIRFPKSRVLFSCTDACNLAFAAATFDKIICYSTFPHIQKPRRALSEFNRVLKSGGKVVIFHSCCSRKLNHYHAKLTGVVSFDKLPKSEYLQTLLKGAGFIEISTIERPDLYWVEAQKREE